MNERADIPSAEQRMYWSEFVQLKAETCYVRDYRNSLNRAITAMAALRAIASASSIGGQFFPVALELKLTR